MPTSDTQPAKLIDSQGHAIRVSRFKADYTVNVPTLITIISLCTGLAVWGVRTYYAMEERTNRNTYDVAVLTDKVIRLESQVSQTRLDNGTAVQALRGEIRLDLVEIKGTLNQIMLRQPPSSSRQLNEWSR